MDKLSGKGRQRGKTPSSKRWKRDKKINPLIVSRIVPRMEGIRYNAR
jgi:hypothetical protein